MKPGDTIGPAGLYASDADLFAFLVKPDAHVTTSGGTLARGVMVWNGETGGRSIGLSTFLLEYVCGNHIVWGASEVREVRRAHVGDAREAWADAFRELARYCERDTTREREAIERARRFSLGSSDDDVVDLIYRARILPQRAVRDGLSLAREHDEAAGDPRSAWGLAHGLTRLSQRSKWADRRLELDRAAGRILEMAR